MTGPAPLLLTHWGAYHAELRDGKLVALAPMPGDPEPSLIGRNIPAALTDDLRIRQPMVRAAWLKHGPASRESRGSGPFVPVSWEAATRLVAGEISRVREAHGNAAIYGGSYGWASAGRFHHAQSQLHRFLNMAGGYVRSVDTHSYAAAEVLLPHILGSQDGLIAAHTSWPNIAAHTRLFVAFGGLPLKNAQVAAGGVGQHYLRDALKACKAAGMAMVNVSPLRSDAPPEYGAEWRPLRPNTDTALMLGICHTLLVEGLHDRAFLASHCTGFERVEAYLTAAPARDAGWAAGICGVPAETIRALARRMAGARTMIGVAWALQRADHGEQPLWAALTLACMLGQVGLPGGGLGYGYGGSNRIGLPTLGIKWPAFPQGRNPVPDFIPVGRLSDMLLRPGEAFTYNGGDHRYPGIRLVYWAGGNPFHHNSDLNRLREAWRRPETVVVHEPWWNPLARHADIVLPCTTSAERDDLGIATPESHLFAMRRLIAPVGEARDDYTILADIAGELGFRDRFTEGRDALGWVRHMYAGAIAAAGARGLPLPDFDSFWALGDHRLPLPNHTPGLFEAFRADPDTAALPTETGKLQLHSARIESFAIPDCPGQAQWIEPAEWLGGDSARRFPLHMISNQPRMKLHSQYDNGPASRAAKIQGREAVWMHPEDAAARGIGPRDIVRIFNGRGQCLAGAVLTDGMMRGVVQLPTGSWWDPEAETPSLDRHGNPNGLTLDKGTSGLAQGPIGHTALVEIELFRGELPEVRAFTPPEILEAIP